MCILEGIVRYIPRGLKETKIGHGLDSVLHPVIYFSPKRYLDYKYESYRLKKFKDIHKGQRCFIVGNGPSILQQDLTRLKDEIVFVANHFPLHPQYDEIRPTYLLSEHMFFPSSDNLDTRLYQLLLEKTGNMTKFFRLKYKPLIKRDNLFAGHSVYYLNYDGGKPIWKTGVMSLDAFRVVYPGGTVVIDLALPLAFYMGFSGIYLLGCDTNFHLYAAKDIAKANFHALPPAVHHDRKFYIEHHNWIIKSYSVAKEAFEKQGRKIYNAGVGGELEVFERVNYDELF